MNTINLKDIDNTKIYECSEISDMPEDLNELHISNEKGDLIYTIEGRDKIKEFFQEQQDLKKELVKDRYEKMLHYKQCQRNNQWTQYESKMFPTNKKKIDTNPSPLMPYENLFKIKEESPIPLKANLGPINKSLHHFFKPSEEDGYYLNPNHQKRNLNF